MLKRLWAIALSSVACLAAAQAPAAAWPESAQGLADDALRSKVAGKVFRTAGGTIRPARLQYQANGFVFLDVSTGFRDTGKWRVEGVNLCTDWQKAPSSGCNETRVAGDIIYLRRTNGELMSLTPE